MKQDIEAVNLEDDEGRPAGGYVEGVGLRIDWQEGPLVISSCYDDQCGCGAPATWRYSPSLGRSNDIPGQVMAGDEVGYCAEHGPNTPPKREPNGAFVETVIAAAIQRIEHYQGSQFRCRENAIAITKLEEAMLWLNARTQRRTEQGVEGTHSGS